MYRPDTDKLELFLKIDSFWDGKTSPGELAEALSSPSWRVQQAALSAIGDRTLKEVVPSILALLEEQDGLDVYGASGQDEWSLDDAKDDSQRETWVCRFRVKQAACIALGKIAELHGVESIGRNALEKLKRYAVSQNDDYPVRAAACEALGKAGDKSALECLEAASGDGEWCTKAHALKSLRMINR